MPITNAENVASYHLANLDVLRAIAVISVVIHHTWAITGYTFPILGTAGGLFGVQLFFLISGYLITESALKHSLPAYALHRAFRILPAYWLVYLSLGLLSGPAFFLSSEADWSAILLNLLNLQQISPKALIQYDFIHVSWTLTIELFWYLTAPVLVILGRRWALWTLVAGILISTSWTYLATLGWFDPWFESVFSTLSPPATSGQKSIIITNAFPGQLVFFIMGSVLYYYRDQLLHLNSTVLNASVVIFLILADALLFKHIPNPTFLTGIGLSAFFLLVLRTPPSGDWLLVRIGKVSYSVYLIHFSILLSIWETFGSNIGWYSIPVAYILIFIVANLLYMGIEKPFMLIGRKLSRRFTEAPSAG